jgi:hypothetical protein
MHRSNKSKTQFYYEWHEIPSVLCSVTFTLFALYIGIKYPIPCLWHLTWKILAIPMIIAWLVVLGIIAFFWAMFAFSLTDALIQMMVDMLTDVIFWLRDIALYMLILVTNSPALYLRISPEWAASLLLRLPTAQCVKILEKMETGRVYGVFLNKEGASLLVRLPTADSMSILQKMGSRKVYDILLAKELKRHPEYLSFLHRMPPELIEECQYCMSLTKRQQFVKRMDDLGIKISLHDDKKPYKSHGA